MKSNKCPGQGGTMTSDERCLIVETLGEMRELKGEMKEFKEHVIGRVQSLEKKRVKGARNVYPFLVF